MLAVLDRVGGPKIRGMIDLIGRSLSGEGHLEVVLILLVGEPWHTKDARGVPGSRIASEALRQSPEKGLGFILAHSFHSPDHLVFLGRRVQDVVGRRDSTVVVDRGELA